jgi:hypothetical protein
MDTVTKHRYGDRLRERIEEVLTESIVWTAGARPDRIIDQIVAAVGELEAKRIVVVACSIHGEIAREEAWCRHDSEEILRRVANAHGASYGASCTTATLNVEIIEP